MTRLLSSCPNKTSGADSSITLSQTLVLAVLSLNQQWGSSPVLGSQAKVTAKLGESGSPPWEFQKQHPLLISQWLWFLKEKNHLFQHHVKKKKSEIQTLKWWGSTITYSQTAVWCSLHLIGRLHAADACKDTFPSESSKSTLFMLTCHISYFSHKQASWLQQSPALGRQLLIPL